jgi:hypothetical protein
VNLYPRIALVIIVLTLGGCIEDQAKTAGMCRSEALTREFGAPAYKDTAAETVKCMSLNGYTKRVSRYCPHLTVGDMKTICYQPDSWLGWIGFQIEMALKPNEGYYQH